MIKVDSKCRCKKLHAKSVKGDEISFACNCGKTTGTYQMSQSEAKKERKRMLNAGGIHKLFHKFLAAFYDPNTEETKDDGYDLMLKVEKFQKKHPEVLTCGVDDSYHASSDLVFIPHANERKVWGISVVYIPQCTGEKPISFFLYPGHLKGLINVLNKLANQMKDKGNKDLDTLTMMMQKEPDDIFNNKLVMEKGQWKRKKPQ